MFWLMLVLFVVAVVVIAASVYTYRFCFYSPKDRLEDPYAVFHGEQYESVKDRIFDCTRKMDEAKCEWVTITSFDGLQLSARYYHSKDNAPLQIMFHGYRSMALRDCAGGYGLAKRMGFNVLVADQRAHAKSDGSTISFGINERQDCWSWTNYAVRRFGAETPIVLSGLSMGAATVLMASSLPLPDNVVAIMADCPYSSPAEIICKVARDQHLPDKLAYPFIKLGAKLWGRFDLEASSSVEAVAKTGIPILLIHGEDDRFVPCDMSRKIYASCNSMTQLHTFPEAGHGLCYIVDPKRYEAVTVRFLLEIPSLKPYLQENPFIHSMSGKE